MNWEQAGLTMAMSRTLGVILAAVAFLAICSFASDMLTF
jgi:hypothetical protein